MHWCSLCNKWAESGLIRSASDHPIISASQSPWAIDRPLLSRLLRKQRDSQRLTVTSKRREKERTYINRFVTACLWCHGNELSGNGRRFCRLNNLARMFTQHGGSQEGQSLSAQEMEKNNDFYSLSSDLSVQDETSDIFIQTPPPHLLHHPWTLKQTPQLERKLDRNVSHVSAVDQSQF